MAHLNTLDIDEREALIRAWDIAGEFNPVLEVDDGRKAAVRRHVIGVASRIEDRRPILRPVLRPVRIFSLRTVSLAATLVVLVGLSFLLAPSAHTLRAPVGQSADSGLILPDGSRVVLASGSVISYTDRFGDKERRVSLRGEAFFDVEDDGTPFFVDTYNARTTVLGTQFSIRAWPTDVEPSTVVRVLEGRVALQSRRSVSAAVDLLPGQAGFISNESGIASEIESSDIATAFSWINGGYAYRNEHIGNVLDDLSRRFDVAIEAPTSVRLLRISYFKKTAAPVTEILDEISGTVGIRFRQISRGFELYIP